MLGASSVTWQRQAAAQGAEEGARDTAGVLWVDLAACAIVLKVFEAGLRQGMGSLWPLSTTLTMLMGADGAIDSSNVAIDGGVAGWQ